MSRVSRWKTEDRKRKGSESIAVGSKDFVELTEQKLGVRTRGCEVVGGEGGCQLIKNNLLDIREKYY